MKLRIALLTISIVANLYFAAISIGLMYENLMLKKEIARLETKLRASR